MIHVALVFRPVKNGVFYSVVANQRRSNLHIPRTNCRGGMSCIVLIIACEVDLHMDDSFNKFIFLRCSHLLPETLMGVLCSFVSRFFLDGTCTVYFSPNSSQHTSMFKFNSLRQPGKHIAGRFLSGGLVEHIFARARLCRSMGTCVHLERCIDDEWYWWTLGLSSLEEFVLDCIL